MTETAKISIKSLNLLVNHEFNFPDNPNQMCALCKRPLMSVPLQELQYLTQSGQVVLNSKVYVGECKHAFHLECMNDLFESGAQSCPIDFTPWKLECTVSASIPLQPEEQTVVKSK